MKGVLALGGALAALYLGVVLWLSWSEDRIVFQPDPGPVPPPPAFLPGGETVRFTSADRTGLTAWMIPPPATDTPAPWMLVLHGNAGHIATPGRPEHDRQLRDLGLGVLALDYRGYGDSEGDPSETGVYADAGAAYEYLRDSLAVPPERIVLYGHSLGSAVAVELATRVPAAGLIIEGAFTSVPDRAAEVYPWLPVRWMARNRFPSLERIAKLRMPLLVIHGREDGTMPISHGRRLYDAAPEPKTFLEVAGGHDDAFEAGAREYETGIRRFLDAVR